MSSIIEAVITKIATLMIDYLWKHHEQKMQDAHAARQQQQIQHAQEASVHASQKADETLVRGAVVAGDVASAGSLRDGSNALNAEIERGD